MYQTNAQLWLAVIPHFSHRRRFTTTIQILVSPVRKFFASKSAQVEASVIACGSMSQQVFETPADNLKRGDRAADGI